MLSIVGRIRGIRLPLDPYVHQVPWLREGASQTLENTIDDDEDARIMMLDKKMVRVECQR